MKIGVIIFAYNRSYHLGQTLEALKKNTGVDKVYIFQDGLKLEKHRVEWEKTKEVIRNIDWCEVVYRLSDVNKGLRKSILDGVNYVFQENEAVVVLEDDCLTTPNFMTFMRQCLDKYKEQEKVYSVSGYAWPLDWAEKKKDAYFCGRISSLGWGTWKDRWDKLEIDYEITACMKKDMKLSEELALWGNDMEDILVGNIKGYTDSWAVFWGLSVIKQGGLCLNPYYSFINNIGFDGSGVHSGSEERAKAMMMDEDKENFDLPDEIAISEDVKCAFPSLFNGVYHGKEDALKKTAIVYGLGNYYKKYECEIVNKYNVRMYIDKRKNGFYAGKKIGKIGDLVKEQYDFVLLMIADVCEAMKVGRELHENYGISWGKIALGYEIF
ncbi:MAG: glycosyltransferase family 2 protein [Lachnospiraceae bacterium]|nr:glycosyltransferase family 2 protein [Lachnospiraceae bacterium]